MTKPIAAKFSAKHPNTTINLGSEQVELRTATKSLQGFGKAHLELAGRERVVVEVTTAFDGLDLFRTPNIQMKFGSRGRFIPVIATGANSSDSGGNYRLAVNGTSFTQVRDHRVRLLSAIVHVLNFPDFCCLGSKGNDFRISGSLRGRVVLRNEDWEIELQALQFTRNVIEQLKLEGGNAFTHVARITRSDSKAFTCNQLELIIHDLHKFISFARGAWTSLFGVVGYDRFDNEVYENWGQRIATPWQYLPSWFDAHHGGCLADAFPGFTKLLHDPNLSKAANAALHWYLRSNRAGDGAGVDGGLILSQAALEGLSSSILANTAISGKKNLRTSDRIRLSCKQLGIRTTIPRSTRGLHDWRRKGVFSDGPEAITKLRNELVHPERLVPGKLPKVIPEAWQLAQWYIEVMLLRLCGYRSVYSNRLKSNWVGEVYPFP